MKRDLELAARLDQGPASPRQPNDSIPAIRRDVCSTAGAQSHEEDLRQRVLLFLASSNVPGLRHVKASVEGDTVILSGRVNSFYEKQLSAECSRRVAGVIHVVDMIEVCGYTPRRDGRRNDRSRPSERQYST